MFFLVAATSSPLVFLFFLGSRIKPTGEDDLKGASKNPNIGKREEAACHTVLLRSVGFSILFSRVTMKVFCLLQGWRLGFVWILELSTP